MYEGITAAGFRDVTRAQFELVRWPSVDGLRPGEVAERTGLSKQAVNDLLGELEGNGYLERHADPDDRRARIVRLTARGKGLQRAAHDLSRELEAAWAETLGVERFKTLRSALEDVVERGLTQR